MNICVILHYKITTNLYNYQIYLTELSLMAIIDYWKSLDKCGKREFRNEVEKVTGLIYPTFYYKIRKNSFTRCEEIVINRLIKSRHVRKNRVL